MKKLIFSLLTSTLFSVSALANYGDFIIEPKYDKPDQLCGVIVTFYDSNDIPYRQQWFTSDQPTYAACLAYQNSVIADLRNKGYVVRRNTLDQSADLN